MWRVFMLTYSGKNVLVTGASRGIGFAIASFAVKLGAKTVVLNGIDSPETEDAAGQLDENEGRAIHALFDAFDSEAVESNYDRIEKEIGPIDVVFSNAGMVLRKAPLEMSAEDFRAVHIGNLDCHFYIAKAAIRSMKARGAAGSLVFTASMNAIVGRTGLAAYASAKSGLAGLMRSLAAEFAPSGIRCNAICPGYVETQMNKELRAQPGLYDRVKNRSPLRRWAKPEDMAGPAVFLGSDLAAYVNGHLLVVDAGLTTSDSTTVPQ